MTRGITIAAVLGVATLVLSLARRSGPFCVSDLDLGMVQAESRIEADLIFENFTDQDRKVLGVKSGCSCVVVGGFPVAVGAGESKSIPFEIATPRAGEAFEVELLLYVDTPGVTQQTVWVRGFAKR